LVMSYLAIEMSKEMRGNSDGIMQTNDGQVVKVASSAFDVNPDGTMVSRDGSSTLQVAQTKPSRQLSSTIPDDVLKKLDMVSLKQADHFVQLKVNGMQRIKMKTSKCGSVVEFETPKGVLTLDDFTISADNQLSGYLQQAGLANVLEDGVFGRRLSAGLLEQMIARFPSSSDSSPKWTTWSGHARASLYQDPRTFPKHIEPRFRFTNVWQLRM